MHKTNFIFVMKDNSAKVIFILLLILIVIILGLLTYAHTNHITEKNKGIINALENIEKTISAVETIKLIKAIKTDLSRQKENIDTFFYSTIYEILPSLISALIVLIVAIITFKVIGVPKNILNNDNEQPEQIDHSKNNHNFNEHIKSLSTVSDKLEKNINSIGSALNTDIKPLANEVKNISNRLTTFINEQQNNLDDEISIPVGPFKDELRRVKSLIDERKVEEFDTHKKLTHAINKARKDFTKSIHVLAATPQSVNNYYNETAKELLKNEINYEKDKIKRFLLIEEYSDKNYNDDLIILMNELDKSSVLKVVSKKELDKLYPSFFRDYGVFFTRNGNESIFSFIQFNGGDNLFTKSPGIHYKTNDTNYTNHLVEEFTTMWNANSFSNKTIEDWKKTHGDI